MFFLTKPDKANSTTSHFHHLKISEAVNSLIIDVSVKSRSLNNQKSIN
jgi:hypothetical protein